jgi:hypothetical protein
MNSDPYDSAAWRTFGMLNPDETLLFDEAMRQDPALKITARELVSLAAAIAAVSVSPQPPSEGQLDRLRHRLKLNHSAAIRASSRAGLAGWICASLLALLLALNWTGIIGRKPAAQSTALPIPSAPARSAALPAATPVETTRLNQEIEELRETLERFQQRDRSLFVTVPGKAWPVVMIMTPPSTPLEQIPSVVTRNEAPSPLVALLGDALATASTPSDETTPETDTENVLTVSAIPEPEYATAISIYDSGRDAGTLVVRQLPPADEGYSYHLWAITSAETPPVFVGSLPENDALESHSFDFSLGSTTFLPLGFVLTHDPQGSPATPTEANTVLQGPPPPTQ